MAMITKYNFCVSKILSYLSMYTFIYKTIFRT